MMEYFIAPPVAFLFFLFLSLASSSRSYQDTVSSSITTCPDVSKTSKMSGQSLKHGCKRNLSWVSRSTFICYCGFGCCWLKLIFFSGRINVKVVMSSQVKGFLLFLSLFLHIRPHISPTSNKCTLLDMPHPSSL